MSFINDYLKDHELIQHWINSAEDFAHLSIEQEALLYYGAYLKKQEKVLIIKESEQAALDLAEALAQINRELRISLYLHESSLRIEALSQSDLRKRERIKSLYDFLYKDAAFMITHIEAAIRRISPFNQLKNAVFKIEMGQVISPKVLIEKLHGLAYQRVKYVDRPFQFSHRGGIIDLYSINYEDPVRIEFFDDEIDSIRLFDPQSQRSLQSLDKVKVIFADDILIDMENREKIVKEIQNQVDPNSLIYENMAEKIEFFRQGIYQPSMYPFLSLWEEPSSLLQEADRLNLLVYLSPYERIDRIYQAYLQDSQNFIHEQNKLQESIKFENLFCDFKINSQFNLISEYQTENPVHLPWHHLELNFSHLYDSLNFIKQKADSYCQLIFYQSDNRQLLIEALNYLDIPYQEKFNSCTAGIYILKDNFSLMMQLEDHKIQTFPLNALLHSDKKSYRYDHKFYQAESLDKLKDLSTYDYVVHRQYGVGKYLGISTRRYGDIEKDFMHIMYAGGDDLFVPLEQFHLVRKYMSKEAHAVKLNRLGSKAWERNKARVKEDVALVADRLVQLYSQRLAAKGHAFSKDNELQKQFEDEFAYELTPDQKTAMLEIKNDMEKPIPMDRLLSGDVGFGKTELAIRASFKAVVDGKQVAFLCPTTILSSQHYETYQDRFKNYPVRIAVLNRFISSKKQKEILEDLEKGRIDILIGTHRILSEDVNYHDLGLLIIDEEQRFGVQDKEKLKAFRVSVDVLSLSATPIPRTLQMSLLGLRSLSQLNTPPKKRLPIMTYVIEKDAKVLRDVMLKEIQRQGQVFYLFNNIDQIYSVANQMQMEIPQANVAVIHGQMDRHDIEDIMYQFYDKELDILVCTTIIETGIDIPNANTMIVDNAHHFGLAQLYQIKGRVGRSDRLAYAYFVVPQKRQLTEVAKKRLQAIKEFSELGSGYHIAMRDLSIRGAGEILGANQSGFIDTVGMELYLELLQEAIDERQGKEKAVKKEYYVQSSAFLPQNFAFSDDEKLDIYESLVQIKDLKTWKLFYQELEDRYGRLPFEVEDLLLKHKAELLLTDAKKIDRFQQNLRGTRLIFTSEYSNRIDGVHLFNLINEISHNIKVKYINRKIEIFFPDKEDSLEHLVQVLESVKEKEE